MYPGLFKIPRSLWISLIYLVGPSITLEPVSAIPWGAVYRVSLTIDVLPIKNLHKKKNDLSLKFRDKCVFKMPNIIKLSV